MNALTKMSHPHIASGKFSFAQARSLVNDLSRPNPKIYWADFLASVITGHVCIHLVYFAHRIFPDSFATATALQAVAFPITVIAYMRAAMFIHELVHLPRDQFRGFRIAWNALCGIFFLIPSFMYYTHVDHHRRKHYGTAHDGEYLALSHASPWWIVGFIAQNLVIPILGFLRFAVISPICWVFPKVRPWVHKHASSMVVDPFYERPEANARVRRIIYMQEALCFVWCVWFIARAPLVKGIWFDWFWVLAYAVGVCVAMINAVRTLGAHRWIGDGHEMSFEDQMLDSVNFPYRPWITELWGPIGTRYHALHHLFPSLPYHNLGQAHRRLMDGLPKDSPYRETVRVSLVGAIAELWQRAREARPSGESLTYGPFRRHPSSQTGNPQASEAA